MSPFDVFQRNAFVFVCQVALAALAYFATGALLSAVVASLGVAVCIYVAQLTRGMFEMGEQALLQPLAAVFASISYLWFVMPVSLWVVGTAVVGSFVISLCDFTDSDIYAGDERISSVLLRVLVSLPYGIGPVLGGTALLVRYLFRKHVRTA